MRCHLVVLSLLLWAGLPAAAGAQVASVAPDTGVVVASAHPGDSASRRADEQTAAWRIGPFVGVAINSSGNSYLGSTPGRDLVLVGIEAVTPVLRAGPVHLSYAAQLVPFAMITGRAAPEGYAGRRTADGMVPGPDRAYAIGVSPFGFELATPLEQRVAVYGAAAAGGLIFARPFPVPEASRINFTLEFGGGALVRAGRDRWVQLGYKFHHVSNAYTARLNPALATNVFYAGYQWSVRLPR